MKKINLNIASGPYVEQNFINYDNNIFFLLSKLPKFLYFIFGKEKKDKILAFSELRGKGIIKFHNCTKKIKRQNSSVDHILCSHFLEHLYGDEFDFVIKDFRRLLKKDATLHIILPDLDEYIEQYLKDKDSDNFISGLLISKNTSPSLTYKLLELIGYTGLQHRWMFNKKSIEKKLINHGFSLLKDDNVINSLPSNHVRINDGSIHVFARK